MEEKQSGGTVAATGGDERPDDQFQEKTTLGGEYNSGVTSADAEKKRAIEKQATMLDSQPENGNDEANVPSVNEPVSLVQSVPDRSDLTDVDDDEINPPHREA